MYADTDFYLALLKNDDWLKNNALNLHNIYKKELWTSQIACQELMFYAYKNKIDSVGLLDSFYQLTRVIDVKLDRNFFLVATHIADKYNTTPFDAMHAAIAKEDGMIISSDSIYEKIGLKRIALEKS